MCVLVSFFFFCIFLKTDSLYCRAYNEQYGDLFNSVIPTNIFGPYDNFHLKDAHVIPALIHQCYLAKLSGVPFVIKGTGRPLRQFIFSEDLAKLMIWSLRHYDDVSPLILSVDESAEVSIADVAALIVKHMAFEGPIEVK